MIWVKIYRTAGEILLAAADEELIGKEFREGKFRLKVSEGFYKEQLVNEHQFLELFNICTVANLVGKKVVDAAIHAGYINSEHVLYIEGVPHAQFSIMEV